DESVLDETTPCSPSNPGALRFGNRNVWERRVFSVETGGQQRAAVSVSDMGSQNRPISLGSNPHTVEFCRVSLRNQREVRETARGTDAEVGVQMPRYSDGSGGIQVSDDVLTRPQCPVDDLAAHQRQHGPDLGNEYLVARDDVLGEHDDVGLFADFQRAEVALLPGRERVPRREGAHRLLARHALLGLPAVVVIRAWATRDGGVDAVERIRTLHGKVRAAGDGDA